MSTPKIRFFGKRKPLQQVDKQAFLSVAQNVVKDNKKTIKNISYIIVSDDELLEINKTHLNHDYYTDIITFDLSADPDQIEAEIYISADRVDENSHKLNTHDTEMPRVLFHGILHLIGFRDKTSKEQKEMRSMEEQCITLYQQKTAQ